MRKQATYIRCDGNGCNVLAEMSSLNETPPGWYHVNQADEQNRLGGVSAGWDFHSLKCVARWARGREEGLRATHNGHGPAASVRVIDAIRELGLDGKSFTVNDVATRAEVHNSTAQRVVVDQFTAGDLTRAKIEGQSGKPQYLYTATVS